MVLGQMKKPSTQGRETIQFEMNILFFIIFVNDFEIWYNIDVSNFFDNDVLPCEFLKSIGGPAFGRPTLSRLHRGCLASTYEFLIYMRSRALVTL